MRSSYPLLGGLAGGAAGSLGGPVIGGLSAGAGVLAGEALKNKDALIEAEEKIVALSHGDVSALVQQSYLVATSPFQSSLQKELHAIVQKAKQKST